MKCPFCGHLQDKVVDSRESKEGDAIRRRRQCLECQRRFTSYERIDEIPYMVVKKDGRRERFERQKVLAGVLKACEKRPVSMIQLEGIADKAEVMVQDSSEREVSTTTLGEMIMTELKALDKVAYVRFASIYMNFKDVQEFMSELKELLKSRE
jgi:transcriptional repressor NrdR